MATEYPIGPVMLDVAGLTLTAQEKEVINHPNTGAVIFFARNYHDPEQISNLVSEIRHARKGPILIAVDQEGGRVQRFQSGYTRLPPACCYADMPELAETAGWLMAAELLAVGVDFSFAPVLDVDCGISQVIGNRSFSVDCGQAAMLASAFRKGMNSAGMAATGKHFPGHGAVSVDSHLAIPYDDREFDEIQAKDLLPFKRLIAEGLEAVMPAHVIYPKVDPNPAGFSPFWLKDILRKELGFEGVIFSDDLNMEGAGFAGDHSERVLRAFSAGCDMALVCNNPAAAEKVIESLPINPDSEREQRLLSMSGKPRLNREELMNNPQWHGASTLIKEFADSYAR
jgi:beta-N-acetylhexosaminidase